METHIPPWTVDVNRYPKSFRGSLLDFCSTLLTVLYGMESAWRQFHPPRLPEIQKALQPFNERLRIARSVFEPAVSGFRKEPVPSQLLQSAEKTGKSMSRLLHIDSPHTAAVDMLKAMHQHCRALECLYPLISVLPPVGRYFLESAVRQQVDDYAPVSGNKNDIGLFMNRNNGYCFYVPETYDGKAAWPLIVALHGGSGNGNDFIWFWMREARTRHYLLLAPTAAGRTWSFRDMTDADAILKTIEMITNRWRVDRSRMLLTGMSDGAIYTLNWGLDKESPFSALAPMAGVLHPVDLSFATGKLIYMVHGTLDWMFPVSYARQAFTILKQAGAKIVFRETADLSHTYPREENAAILTWFDDTSGGISDGI